MANKKGAAEAAPASSVSGIIDHLKKTSAANVCRMTEAGSMVTVPKFLSTGLPTIDSMLGGGIPAGRVTELYSKGEGIGKSTLAAMVMAEMQRQGGDVMLMDTEHGFIEDRLRIFGVNPEEIIWVRPKHIEHACGIISQTLEFMKKKEGSKLLIVWDSLTGTPSKSEVEADYEDKTVAASARALSSCLKTLKDEVAESECYVIGIVQTRENIGGGPFSEKHQATGGMGVKYYAGQRVVMYRGANAWIKDGPQKVGFKVTMHTEKSRVASPFQKAEATLIFASGYDRWKSLFDLMLHLNLIEQKGGYYEMPGHPKAFRQNDFEEVLTGLAEEDKVVIVGALKSARLTLPAIQYFIPEAE